MAQRRYYRVGDLAFSMALETEQTALLTNYAPFACDEAAERLFDLVLGSVDASAEAAHVFTDSSDDDMPRIELYRLSNGGWLLQIAPTKSAELCLRLQTSADFREAVLQPLKGCDLRFAIDNAAMLLYAFTTAQSGVLEMHASVTVLDGLGFLFLGRSGTGKSTHSRLWHEAFPDAWLLNDDNPVLRLMPDGEVRVYGTPWSGKTPCYKALSVPVRGIVQLAQAPANAIRPLRLPEAYAHMLASCSGLKIVPEMMDGLYQTISRIVQTLPVYQLDCLPNTDAARLCHATLMK